LLPFYIGDSALFSQMLEQYHHVRTAFVVPRRGEKAQMVSLAIRNAREEAERVTQIEERTNATILLLKKMLDIPAIHRIESYDISNVSGTDIVAGMVVFQDGKQKRSEYRRFKIKYVLGQDDYQSMYETIYRRFKKGLAKEKGFDTLPDLLLIDGGVVHAQTAVRALKEIGLDLPVFGMVKDDRHRTRALVSPHGQEIRIDNNQSIFTFIGSIQEETHRFAITYHKKLRSKRLKYSQLDEITGIGATRKQMLLRVFKSLNGIANARLFELEQYLPKGVAKSVYDYFNEDDNGGSDKCE
jgi:excinuclease ABC subunit C